MYFEILDAIPLIAPGCYHANAEQYGKAANYYHEHGDEESENYYRKLATIERIKAEEEENLTWFGKLVRKWSYVG